jgi:hypothetical protein
MMELILLNRAIEEHINDNDDDDDDCLEAGVYITNKLNKYT